MLPDLSSARILIWGLGREGLSAAAFIRRTHPLQHFVFAQDSRGTIDPTILSQMQPLDCVVQGDDAISDALRTTDLIVKSPGVSAYHPLIAAWQADGKPVTSLLNLWCAAKGDLPVILVTGTKGKSTTSALIAHVLTAMKKRVCLAGNIGVPLGEINPHDFDVAVLETSSYQAAGFDGMADIALVTSLYPEHLDWHGDVGTYYRDKLRLLSHARTCFVTAQVRSAVPDFAFPTQTHFIGTASDFHVQGGLIYNGDILVGAPRNAYLMRGHNLENCALALAALAQMGIEPHAALEAMTDFRGLPHRQCELGTQDGILFVDDSISTTPQSAIAALEAYRDRHVSILLGGYDRGLDYSVLAEYLARHPTVCAVCHGACGERIAATLRTHHVQGVVECADLKDAVAAAVERTPTEGVIILSPAAPSYDAFTDFTQRGAYFARLVGF